MSEQPPKKRRGIGFGEAIALIAVGISAAGLYNSWQDGKREPTEVVERKAAIPLVLRGQVEDGGRRLVIGPVEDTHALESLELALAKGAKLELGGDGVLTAGEIEDGLPEGTERKGDGRIVATTTARYVESGEERTATRRYAIRYRWEGGGLFDDRDLRLTGFQRA
jgi:hypothetical protein